MKVEKRKKLIFFTTLIFIALGGLVAIGTLIPQGLSYVAYIELLGLRGANLVQSLGFDDIYHHSLLWGLSLLLVCTLVYYLYLNLGKDVGGFTLLGRWLFHLGLILILVGSGLSAITNEEEPISLSIGEVSQLKEPGFKGIALELLDFKVDFYEDGLPKQYYAKVNLKTDKGEVTDEIEVNHPLYFKGYRLYQESYAWESFGSITSEKSKRSFRLKLGEKLSFEDGVMDTLVLPSYDETTKEVGVPRPSSPHLLVRYQKDSAKEEVIIPYQKEAKVGDLSVSFDGYQAYSGLSLKWSRGLLVLKLGYLALVIGSLLMLIKKFRKKGGSHSD